MCSRTVNRCGTKGFTTSEASTTRTSTRRWERCWLLATSTASPICGCPPVGTARDPEGRLDARRRRVRGHAHPAGRVLRGPPARCSSCRCTRRVPRSSSGCGRRWSRSRSARRPRTDRPPPPSGRRPRRPERSAPANGSNPISIIVPCHRVIGGRRFAHRLRRRAGCQGMAALARGDARRAVRVLTIRYPDPQPGPNTTALMIDNYGARNPASVVRHRESRGTQLRFRTVTSERQTFTWVPELACPSHALQLILLWFDCLLSIS